MVDVTGRLLEMESLPDAGWCAAMAASTGLPASRFASVLSGAASVKDLPVAAAVATVERVLATNPERAAAALEGETRVTPTMRLVDHQARVAPPGTRTAADLFDELAEFARTELEVIPSLQSRISQLAQIVAGRGAPPVQEVPDEVVATVAVAVLCGVAVPRSRSSMDGSAFRVADRTQLLAVASELLSALTADVIERCVAAFVDGVDTLDLPAAPSDAAAGAARAALLCAGVTPKRSRSMFVECFARTGGSLDQLAAAFEWVCDAGLDDAVKLGSTRTTVAEAAAHMGAWCHSAGMPWLPDTDTGPAPTVAGIAGALPLDPAAADAEPSRRVDLLVAAMCAAKCFRDAEAVCVAATANGTHRRRLPSADLSKLVGLSPSVALAVRDYAPGTSNKSHQVARFAAACCDGAPQRWDPDAVCAALDANPVFDEMLRTNLRAACRSNPLRDEVPAFLVDRACTDAPLAKWLDHEPTAARFCAATAELSAERWAVLLGLLEGFRGTIAELVEVTAQLAPTCEVAA